MTVASQEAMSGPYLCNGLTTSFDYKFKIFDKGHLTLTLHKADGVSQTLLEGVDYTVSGVGESQGGQIALHVAPLTGEQLTISRNVPFVQGMDLENQGAFYAEVIEQAFDEAVMRDQQLKEKLDRAITVPENVSAAAKTKLVADITRLAGSADNIDKLVPIRADIEEVAAIADDVTSVAGFDVPAIIAAHEYAHQWAVRAQDSPVNDGVHEQGFSAYHWAQKAAASAATAEAVAGFDPDTKLDKTGGVMSGTLVSQTQVPFRSIQDNRGVFFEHFNDGFSILLTGENDPDGGWNGQRPFTIDTTTGNVEMSEFLNIGQSVTIHGGGGKYPFYNVSIPDGADHGGGLAMVPQAGGKRSEVAYLDGGGVRIWIDGVGNVARFTPNGAALFMGEVWADNARLQTNGDIRGATWEEWGSEWAKQAISAKIENRINARCVTDTRFAGYANGAPSGYVIVYIFAQSGQVNGASGHAVKSVDYNSRQPQIYIPDIGWRALGSW